MGFYPDLAGKVAIVTGGSVGIGESVVRMLAANKVNVAVVGRSNRETAEAAAAAAREQGVKAIAILADVGVESEVERMFAETEARLGPVDILVNNAGGTAIVPLTEITVEEWDRIQTVNLRSCFLCTRRALPGMMARGWGRIINVASEAGRMPMNPTSAAYAASKAGMIGFTKHVAFEVAHAGVTINCTAPGLTWSPRVRRVVDDERRERLVTRIPAGRLSEPEEQAGIIVFLASDEASYVNGACVDVSGGKINL
ncbi:MAG: 3-oxoacyl-ACP reductase FabG [Gemmataceae bacterium]|nr:3-oxoacyl-ACP reductase FabG [Gemmataceae bacterium]